ncbi:hypothetical protein, partial [Escherichia coli]|uniref:hypothetical protein n=1 Tax=Escherichia coli TaxID=562 RepID=UPI001B8A984D
FFSKIFKFLKISFIYLFLAVLGLHCFSDFSPVAESRGYSPAAVYTLLIAVASLLQSTSSRAQAQ